MARRSIRRTGKIKWTGKVRVERKVEVRSTIRQPFIPDNPPPTLPFPAPIRQIQQSQTVRQTPLRSAPLLVRDSAADLVPDPETGKTYDLFISHASENKDDFVRPLAYALQVADLDVWYDDFELKWGDSLRRKIDRGVASSRFGLVVLSKHFFAKGWTNYELDGIVARYISGEQQILPIWHGVSKAEVMAYSPSLADKVALSTDEYSIDEIVAEMTELLRDA